MFSAVKYNFLRKPIMLFWFPVYCMKCHCQLGTGKSTFCTKKERWNWVFFRWVVRLRGKRYDKKKVYEYLSVRKS